jgi:PST family polysaccharide transporter
MTHGCRALVSVIIPVYNGERYLGEAIESVLAQTHRPIDVIVVDDGSTDGSSEVAKGYSASVGVAVQANAGSGAARNRGVELARGGLLAFLDADDRWPEYKLARQVEALELNPQLDAVFGQVRQLRDGPEWKSGVLEPSCSPAFLMTGYVPGTMLIRREAFLRVGPFQTAWKVGEFIDWYARATEIGLQMECLPDLVLWRRVHQMNQGIVERASVSDYAKVIKASLDRRRAAARGNDRPGLFFRAIRDRNSMATDTMRQPGQGGDLTAKTVTGATWSTLGVVGQRGLSLLSTLVLARLLMPSAYGLLGMAMVFVAAVESFRDLGTSSALIQRKGFSHDLTSSLFWINILFGLAGAGLIVGIAPLVAVLYHEPQVKAVLAGLAVSFLVTNLGVVQRALLIRRMSFRQLALIQWSSALVSAVIGIGMAISGAGVWSLVGALISESVITVALYWAGASWRPRWHLSFSELRSVTSYSLHLTGADILHYVIRNADKALIGRYLGAVALGFYSLAYGLMMYPLFNIAWMLGRVLFPAFAQIQEDNARFRRAYLRALGVISAITFPLMLGMIVTADVLVVTCFGAKWLAMVPLVMILAPVGMLQSVGTTIGTVFTAKGRTDIMFRWALLETVLAFAAYVVGLRWGVNGVAAAYGLISFLVGVSTFVVAMRLIELPMGEVGRALWPALKNALVMCGVVLLLRAALGSTGVTRPWAVLAATVSAGVVVYGGLFFWSRPPVLQDVLQVLHLGRLPWLRRLAALCGG